MKVKLLIIGKNSFIGDNLYKFSNKKKNIKKISYSNFFKINKKKLSSFDILSCKNTFHPCNAIKAANSPFPPPTSNNFPD